MEPNVSGIGSLPGFAESLRLLLKEEQYGSTDIAMMFGVSRERIRQIAEELGYTNRRPGGMLDQRVWDDELNRFRPVRRALIRRELSYERRRAGRESRRKRVLDRRAWFAAAVAALGVSLGRSPTLQEIARECFGVDRGGPAAGGYISTFWCKLPGEPRRQSLTKIWAAIGFTPRPRGSPGHSGPRKTAGRSDRCRRGHDLLAPNARNARSACLSCIREMGKLRYAAKRRLEATNA